MATQKCQVGVGSVTSYRAKSAKTCDKLSVGAVCRQHRTHTEHIIRNVVFNLNIQEKVLFKEPHELLAPAAWNCRSEHLSLKSASRCLSPASGFLHVPLLWGADGHVSGVRAPSAVSSWAALQPPAAAAVKGSVRFPPTACYSILYFMWITHRFGFGHYLLFQLLAKCTFLHVYSCLLTSVGTLTSVMSYVITIYVLYVFYFNLISDQFLLQYSFLIEEIFSKNEAKIWLTWSQSSLCVFHDYRCTHHISRA